MSERRCECCGSLVWVGHRYMCADCGRTSNPHIAAARAKVEEILKALEAGFLTAQALAPIPGSMERIGEALDLMDNDIRAAATAALKELDECQ